MRIYRFGEHPEKGLPRPPLATRSSGALRCSVGASTAPLWAAAGAFLFRPRAPFPDGEERSGLGIDYAPPLPGTSSPRDLLSPGPPPSDGKISNHPPPRNSKGFGRAQQRP